MSTVLYILAAFFVVRIISLLISVSNEKKLIRQGAKQYGKLNSTFLSLLHITFYSASFYEAYINRVAFNGYSRIGLLLLFFAYAMLFYVIYALREVWTVKVYIAPNHKVVKSFLFRTVRHPNYFLNIIPELIGVGLLCNAWNTLLFVFPVYLVVLSIRIFQEEKAMKCL